MGTAKSLREMNGEPPAQSLSAVAREPRLARLRRAIEHAAHLLPAQGPITVFIHHNTLHAFEDLPFDEGVKKGAQIFGCQPYLTEDRYRQELGRGHIRFAHLEDVLAEDLGDRAPERILGLCTRLELRQAMLAYPLRTGPAEELRWYVAEKNALRRVRGEASSAVRDQLIAETRRWVMRDLRGGHEAFHNGRRRARPVPDTLSSLFGRFNDSAIEQWTDADWQGFTLQALWRICCDGVQRLPAFAPHSPPPVRHRDLLWEATGADADLPVHAVLARFCAAFLDQGIAPWELPERDQGIYHSFCALYRRAGGPPDGWMRGLDKELARLQDARVGPLLCIHESLALLGVGEDEWDRFLSATLLALRGWAGMVRQLEVRGDRVAHPAPEGSLIGFLAIRLLLDRVALAWAARRALDFTGPLNRLRGELHRHLEPPQPGVEQRAFLVFQLAQVLGWLPEELHRLNPREWATLLAEIEAFTGLERRRIFHWAFERRFYTQALDAIALHVQNPAPTPRQPRFQAVFCIDEREESIRRHLEELAPDAATYSTAGFFSIPMYFRGADDAHFVPLCPPVIQPQHWVVEKVVENLEETHQRSAMTRRALGIASHRFHVGSRTFALGAVLAALVGVLASFPLVARTLFPRLTARLRKKFGRMVQTPPLTRLQLERSDAEPGPDGEGIGFTLEEMTEIAHKVLREIGLTSGFSRLVLLLGHGSTSLNNPHESAHDCGACGGARGGPNARALAQMLNDFRIRERLKQRGIVIPGGTRFIGGMHNTSNETAVFYDLDRLAELQRAEFESVRAVIELACDRDAHERVRRFDSAPLTLSFDGARQHVEGRAEDLAQVRPEWGHATNAICIVGRREWTRGLFLDRRAFLTSYDPEADNAESTILAGILQAVFPVCAGISLEYYFSYVDNAGWGCGTKLPHNITALLGVLDGAASDLRTGLPWQMVEIHEPVRLLFVIETTPEAMLRIMDRNAGIGRLCRNAWVHVALLDPHTRALSFFRGGRFEEYRPRATALPQAASSVDWYRGWRDHLEFAQIDR